MDYKLIIFDLDGTLAPYQSDELYPDARAWLERHDRTAFAICSNQGGIGLRLWMELNHFGDPTILPTLADVKARLDKLFPQDKTRPAIYICARYQSKKSGKWSPVPDTDEGQHMMWREDWRKPAHGMLHEAMNRANCWPEEVLMVGDGEEDKQAAEAAGCQFQWAWQFFGRPEPLTPEEGE